MSQQEKSKRFVALHERTGAFIIPNPWDGGSARLLQGLGFEALATSSSACAANYGRRDGAVSRVEALAHARAIVEATELPVAGDLEKGFGDSPEDAAATIREAASIGLVGGSIEDATGDPDQPLHEFDLAVARIAAARRAIDDSGTAVVLTGRSEGFVVGRPDIDETVRRLQAYAEAGADCLYAPRLDQVAHVEAIVSAVAPLPVNLLINAPFITVAEAADLGVRRISVGGTLARTAWGGWLAAARELAESGTVTAFDDLPNVDALLGR